MDQEILTNQHEDECYNERMIGEGTAFLCEHACVYCKAVGCTNNEIKWLRTSIKKIYPDSRDFKVWMHFGCLLKVEKINRGAAELNKLMSAMDVDKET